MKSRLTRGLSLTTLLSRLSTSNELQRTQLPCPKTLNATDRPLASAMAAPSTFPDMGLSIIGLGTEYPPHTLTAKALNTLGDRFYPESDA